MVSVNEHPHYNFWKIPSLFAKLIYFSNDLADSMGFGKRTIEHDGWDTAFSKYSSPGPRPELESFVRHDDSAARLSPAELGALAKSMAETPDDNEASELEEKIIAGFYGTK